MTIPEGSEGQTLGSTLLAVDDTPFARREGTAEWLLVASFARDGARGGFEALPRRSATTLDAWWRSGS